jgi:hypothetical protein
MMPKCYLQRFLRSGLSISREGMRYELKGSDSPLHFRCHWFHFTRSATTPDFVPFCKVTTSFSTPNPILLASSGCPGPFSSATIWPNRILSSLNSPLRHFLPLPTQQHTLPHLTSCLSKWLPGSEEILRPLRDLFWYKE